MVGFLLYIFGKDIFPAAAHEEDGRGRRFAEKEMKEIMKKSLISYVHQYKHIPA